MHLGKIQNQYIYNDQYQKENIRRVVVKFNRKVEEDTAMLDHLSSKESVQRYIKDLIKADMDK